MLANSAAIGTYSISDAADAKRFYADTLGLDVSQEYGGQVLVLHITGGRDVRLYSKPNHTPASFTVLDFPVDDIRQTVQALRARGVEFQRYDQFEMDENNVHHGPGHDIAWFTDPAGNTLSVTQRFAA